MIRLQTDRLLIRDPKKTDLDGWHRLRSDPKTMYYLDDILTHSMHESKKDLKEAIEEAKKSDRTKYFLAMEEEATGEYVGSIGYIVEEILPVGKVVHVGYFILPAYHSKGYTTEAFREVIRFAFEEDNVFRLKTGCCAENKASERVMQKCGLIKEGEHKACVWIDGKMRDRVSYRMLQSEWKQMNETKPDFQKVMDQVIAESIVPPLEGKGAKE